MEEKLMPKIDFNGYCKDKYILNLGNYEIKEENGKTYAVRKRLGYPKTYEECCEMLAYEPDEDEIKCYRGQLIESFVKLLICRNAYWKIVGDEMGLGKPWKPDWKNDSLFKYIIACTRGSINKDIYTAKNCILVFPTKEIRDAFYENFKDLIECCKELL